MSNACRPVLEAALKRTLSDQEYNQIVSDFTQAQKDAAKAFGKGFNSLPKADRAKAISNQLNVNRAKALTNIEAQLLSNANIADIGSPIKTTQGQSLELIDAKEYADNINNLIGNTTTRTGFLNRGGSRLTYDVVTNTIKNTLAKAFLYDSPLLTQGIDDIVEVGGTIKNRGKEDDLAQKIMDDPNILKPILDSINKVRVDNGVIGTKNKLEMSVSREDITYLWENNGRNEDLAAAAFKSIVDPLLINNSIDLELLYKNLLKNADQLDNSVARSPIAELNNLTFKDGKSYMDFIRVFGQNKDLITHITATMENTARDVAKKVVFGDENVVANIDTKIAMLSKGDDSGRKALERSKRAYQEVTGEVGRNYTKGILDLTLSTIKNWTSAQFLGISPIKGAFTDTINATATYGARGEVSLAIRSQVETFTNFGKGDRSTFITGIDEFVNSTQHYLNTAGESVMAKNPLLRGLQRTDRFTRNLAGKVQALAGQNAVIKAKKRALGRMAEEELFKPTLKPELADSINPLTHAAIIKLGIKNLDDLYKLDRNAYNSKLGKSVDDVEFSNIHNQLKLEMEGAIMHQVQAIQIDSGGISVSSQNARFFGEQNSIGRRYVLPVLGQFMAYSQNYILKNSLVRSILSDPTLAGKIKYGMIIGTVVIASGYSNYNVSQALRSGSKEPVFADPIRDIEAIFGNDEEEAKLAQERFNTNLLSGASIPGVKQGLSILGDGKVSSIAPSMSYMLGVLNEMWDTLKNPTDGEQQAQLLGKLAGFSTPGLYDILYRLKEELKEEN